ncbi:hypothetical protein B9Z19DRAFT_1037785 [Tuber borchii]|uniref:NACHT domain-containing protein n=1 Tax=Tuber borchii TaxID=42251 RepID=A0A2T7A8Y2_TUBBO|nr:hypothetical protein B9Z19DRAFT_1037785 [Tuber borchii]
MLAKGVAAEFLGGPDSYNGVKAVFNFIPPELPTDENSVDEDRLSQLTLAKVASDLLYSILQQDGSLFDACKAELCKQGNRFFTNPSSLWKVLRKTIQDCQTDPVYILIDGVDGLGGSSHEELIRRILGLMEIRTVKIFLSSRDVPYISNNLPHSLHEYKKINLDTNSFVKADVETFIKCKVNAWGWDMELRERAMACLLAKSDGIFLWASLAVKSLSYFHLGLDFDESLRKLPVRLTDVYRTMLHKLFLQGGPQKVLHMIQSVALALRPLTFGELGYILACIEGKGSGGEEKQLCYRVASSEIRPRSEKEIRMYVQSSMGFLRATDTTVSVVHYTAVEYLFDENRKDNLPVLSKSQADLTISWECFRYLHHAFGDPERFLKGAVSRHYNGSQDRSLGQYSQEETLRETPWEMARKNPLGTLTKWPYLRYAAESWFIHARQSIEVSKNKFCDDSTHDWFQHQFFETNDIVRKPWIALCGDPRMEILAGEQTPLHIAVCLGLVPLVEKALSESTKGTNSNCSPLHLAAKFISGAYKILIDRSEPSLLTVPDHDGNTPLHEAAISGHSSMFKALVKKLARHKTYCAEINKKNHFGNTPLHLAFQFDHLEIVELLAKGGADATIKNYAQMTPSELGAKLERGDSLDVLKRDESYWGGRSWRGGVPTGSQASITQNSTGLIITQDVHPQRVDVAMTPLPISTPNFHQPNPETHPIIPYDMTAGEEVSRSHSNDAINPPNIAHYSKNTNYFDNDIGQKLKIGVTAERFEILAWLSPLEPRIKHQELRVRRADNIGEWLLRTDEFQRWCGGAEQDGSEHATLFCCGGPAAGKTYFSSLVVDWLCDKAKEQNIAVAYFYVDFTARGEQFPAHILSSLLKQIVGGLDRIPDVISRTFQIHKKEIGGRGMRVPKILKMLQDVTSLQPTFICVDAVDEFMERQRLEILDSLRLILEKSPNTRTFLTGRGHIQGEIDRHLGTRAATLSIKPNNDDIVGYIRMRLRKDTSLSAMDSGLEEEIIKSIAENIPETFLPISLTMDAILSEETAYERRQRLMIVAESLHSKDVYDATLAQIKEQGEERTWLGMAALMWTSHSERPLYFDELSHALAVEIGSRDLNPERIPSLETLLSICSGLIAIDRQTSAVRLIHPTLWEYLHARPELFGPAHSIMAETCLTYLNFRAIKDISPTLSAPPHSTPFLNYSSLYWGVHARRDTSKEVLSLALQLFSQVDNHISTRLLLADLISRTGRRSRDIPIDDPLTGFTRLHCASVFGITAVATALIDQPNCDLNGRDFLGITPLIWAAICGQEEVAKLLLERPTVNPDKPDGYFRRTALSWAAKKGHEGIVRLLLGWATAKPDGTDGWWGKTPSVLNKVRGRRYVNPNWQDKYGQAPILLAAEEGHGGIVQLLLGRKDIKSDKPDSDGQTPLSCASKNGHEGVVKILLGQKDVSPSQLDGTPLLGC